MLVRKTQQAESFWRIDERPGTPSCRVSHSSAQKRSARKTGTSVFLLCSHLDIDTFIPARRPSGASSSVICCALVEVECTDDDSLTTAVMKINGCNENFFQRNEKRNSLKNNFVTLMPSDIK